MPHSQANSPSEMRSQPLAEVVQRVAAYNWSQVAVDLDQEGAAVLPGLLTQPQCDAVAALYAEESSFRKTIIMNERGYGSGTYKYFAYPLPALVATLREHLYAQLVPIANRWQAQMRAELRYPAAHEEFVQRCHAAGQRKPTPLMLEYVAGDFNCLHQDVYGAHVFPLQVVVLLSQPNTDFTGGHFVTTQKRRAGQTKANVLPLLRADAAVFAVNNRPSQGTRGYHQVSMQHGVSTVHTGHRQTMGIIFHDAQ